LARATVRKYALAEPFPRQGLRGPEPSILEPYLDHLQARHCAGCENAMHWRELRALGFTGTSKQVRRWLTERHARPAKTMVARCRTPPAASPTATAALPPLSAPKPLSWHLLRELDVLDGALAAEVARDLQNEEAAKVVDLGHRFCRMVCSRSGRERAAGAGVSAFDAWLEVARL
jgi:hypothetical protein